VAHDDRSGLRLIFQVPGLCLPLLWAVLLGLHLTFGSEPSPFPPAGPTNSRRREAQPKVAAQLAKFPSKRGFGGTT
jgi:hypothetical protein